MLAIIGLVLGLVLGIILDPSIPIWLQPYLPIMVVASIDALLGALRAYLESEFSDRAFIISYLWNVLLASFLVFIGDQLGVGSQMTTAVVVVLGIRIFSNAASLRRYILE
ncbi:small basic family protein [Actinomycetaceae bacterium TAE3-ERU4]|nr:small basic family protein [Actinomycetaceae bacterium TAE3-ERU4]